MPTPVLSRHFFSKNVRYIFFTKITLPFTGLSGQNSNGPSKIIGNNVYPVLVLDASPIVRRFDRSVRCHLHIFFLSFFLYLRSLDLILIEVLTYSLKYQPLTCRISVQFCFWKNSSAPKPSSGQRPC